ncbi:MAG: ABC transporter ATP-binding protein [Actinomycetota bacterium]|nr:ABC transporter ATP-binding protein [Actinomycetota bacterium]
MSHVRLPAAPPISVAGLRAGYGRIEVLHGIDLHVPAGSVFALLGTNGAGKSTLLKVIAGHVRATAGDVRIGDVPVGSRSVEHLARQGVCLVPEGRGIFPNLTVRENLRIWTYASSIPLPEVEERTYAAFPRLSERRQQAAGTLSGGEQQMLAISRALVSDPSVLLIDELSMGLAPLIVAELYQMVAKLAEGGMTVLLVEQFVTTALAVASRAAIMANGRITGEGTPAEMADAALSAYLS